MGLESSFRSMVHDPTHVAEALRRLRTERKLSLTRVAEKAGISVATLSRVETNKQNLDIPLLFTLARVLGVSPAEIVADRDGDGGDGKDSLMHRLSTLRSSGPAGLPISMRRRDTTELATTVDDILTTLDMMRDELLRVHKPVRSRRNR